MITNCDIETKPINVVNKNKHTIHNVLVIYRKVSLVKSVENKANHILLFVL